MKTKRFLSILLSLVLVLGMFPGMSLTASAEGNTTTITPTNTSGTMTITLTIKAAQTITASDVTATYGDTDKSVSASVTEPTTGGGAISYAVKEGSENYIDVDADGKLTIKAVPPTDGKAYVIVTAAETDDYAETTKEVTVTISNAPPVITLSDFPETYDGNPKKLISSVVYSGTEDLYLRVDCLTSFKNKIYWAKYTGSSDLTNVFAPTNAGTYSVYYFVGTPDNPEGGTRVDGQTSINKALPRVNNFTFTAPSSLNYDGTAKTATVTIKDGVTGMGDVTVKYYSDADRNNEVAECINAGTYYVGIDVGDGENYVSDDQLYDDSWKFTIASPHTHSFTYTADSDTITATCGNDGCDLTESKAILTIAAPTLTIYGGTGSAAATLTGLDAFNTATNKTIAATDIKYVGRDGTTYTESTTAPSNAGKYTASITVEEQTASVDYEIAQATTTITVNPTASDITYGQTLADSTLTGGTGSVAGTFAWKDSTIVPAVSDSQKTEYDVVFTPTDGNYATAECKVKLTVIKADASRDVPEKALPYTGQPQELVTAGTVSGGTLQYALGTDANTAPADGWSTEIPTATEPGTYYVWYKVVGDENHNGVDPACIVVTIAAPTSQETPAAAPATPESVSDYTLLASMKTSGNKAFKLKWTAVTGAEGYDVFFGPCGGQHELKKTVTGTSCKIGKLKKGNAYAAFVKAWRTENGQKVYIGQPSPDVHAVAGGKSNKYTNAKKISVKKKKLTVAVGGSKKIRASLKKFSNSRRYLNHTAKIRYYSSNRAVATVNAKGKVTGVAPGTCTVYAVAENGLRKGVKITVK